MGPGSVAWRPDTARGSDDSRVRGQDPAEPEPPELGASDGDSSVWDVDFEVLGEDFGVTDFFGVLGDDFGVADFLGVFDCFGVEDGEGVDFFDGVVDDDLVDFDDFGVEAFEGTCDGSASGPSSSSSSWLSLGLGVLNFWLFVLILTGPPLIHAMGSV